VRRLSIRANSCSPTVATVIRSPSPTCQPLRLRVRGLSTTKEAYAFRVFEAVFKQFGLPKVMRTDNGVPFASPNSLFCVRNGPGLLARSEGFEPPTPRFEVCLVDFYPLTRYTLDCHLCSYQGAFAFYPCLFPTIRFAPFCLRGAYVPQPLRGQPDPMVEAKSRSDPWNAVAFNTPCCKGCRPAWGELCQN
jgi:hypothetical protein